MFGNSLIGRRLEQNIFVFMFGKFSKLRKNIINLAAITSFRKISI